MNEHGERSTYLTALYLELIVERESDFSKHSKETEKRRRRNQDRENACVCVERERGRESACGEINRETEEICVCVIERELA